MVIHPSFSFLNSSFSSTMPCTTTTTAAATAFTNFPCTTSSTSHLSFFSKSSFLCTENTSIHPRSSAFLSRMPSPSLKPHPQLARFCPYPTHSSTISIRMDLAGQGIYATSPALSPSEVRVVIFGCTGYIGKYVTKEFIRRGYSVVAFGRRKAKDKEDVLEKMFPGAARCVYGDVMDAASVKQAFEVDAGEWEDWDGEGAARFKSTVVVSCLASRGGGIQDSNRIDYQATLNTLHAHLPSYIPQAVDLDPTKSYAPNTSHFILLSAICVQKPLLEFQRAKLKFEAALQQVAAQYPHVSYSIVRPTAFFKSLAGQIERMKQGKPYIMFNDGRLSKCNAISEQDLAEVMADCAVDPQRRNAILPVGGPGEPVTPIEQADMIFKILGKEPKYQKVPIGLMDVIIGGIDFVGKFLPNEKVKDAAEFGRIGKYYATEDMVGPSYGKDTLEDFFKYVAENGLEGQELGEAAVF